MRRWLIRVGLGLAVLLVVALLGGWLLLRASLPRLQGQLALPGLTAPVALARDANGTVTIEARNKTDAMRALGFVHAQERFFEMDLMRRLAAGELSALVGKAALDADRQHRVHRLRPRMHAALAGIAGSERASLLAYAEGVNAGLAALPVRPWPYLLLRQAPRPWRAEDTPLVAMAMYFDLQGGDNASELALWRMQPTLPPALMALLHHDGTRWDAPLQGLPRGDAVLPEARQLDLRGLPGLPPASVAADAHAPGSNNFAVAGSLTRDGRAILADDMHLGLRAPSIWFRARLRYPDPRAAGGRVEVQGFTLPGLPAVVAGSNGHVAWGFTNSYIDTQDWKLETPCRMPAQTGCAQLRSHRERIDIAGAKPVVMEVAETAWGPVLHRLPDGRLLSLRWVAQLPGAVNLQLAHFAVARDLDDALRIAQGVALPTQNLLLADAKGQIAWRLLGPVPQRAAGCGDGSRVIDAHSTDCPPWPITTRDPPLLRSPDTPRLWTANARLLDGAALAQVGDGGYALGARQQQIRDALQARQQFSERDLLALQLDDRALFLTPWWQLLQERAKAAPASPALHALATAAARWQGHASVDSVSYRITRDWRLAVQARLKDGLTAPARAALGKAFEMPALPQFEGVAWPLVTQRPMHLLPKAYASWDALFEDAASEVRTQLERQGPLAGRTWGEQNTSAICHPLAKVVPLLGKRWLCMPAQPLAGDRDMPRVTGPAFGASERMVVAPGHEADGIIELPGGQSDHPLSPFWGAGHQDWMTGKPSPFLPGPARYTLTLTPGQP